MVGMRSHSAGNKRGVSLSVPWGQGPRALAACCILACILMLVLAYPVAAFADEEHSNYASERDYGSTKQVGVYGMTPISGTSVADGTYTVKAQSSSSFFRFEDIQLTVANGSMSAHFTMTSGSYTLIYPGSAEDAAAAPASDYIEIDPAGDTFTMAIPALNEPLPCAAFSKSKRKWYDRQILIDASSLPAGALAFELPDYGFIQDALDAYDKPLPGTEEAAAAAAAEAAEAEERAAVNDPAAANAAQKGPEAIPIDLADGTYSIEVNMTGGSGRASVSSPTWLVVRNGKAYARLLWSSMYYDYMIVEDTTYLNETVDGGNSTFTIPIIAMDEEIPVIADTTAMGDPVEIEYKLTFYSDTVGGRQQIPQEAAILVLEIALAIIIVGGILNYIIKRIRRKKR